MKRLEKGFTLVEIAVVLVIIGLLIGGSMTMLSEQRKSVKLKESQEKLMSIKEALLNFVVVNGYLPCADGDNDGLEDRDASNPKKCLTVVGEVPFQNLGLSLANVTDSYHNKIRYAINTETTDAQKICYDNNPTGENQNSANYFCAVNAPNFTLQTPPTASAPSSGDYTICDDVDNCSSGSNVALDQASVVLVAFNQDGYQQIHNCNSISGAKEKQNCDTNQYYVKGIYHGEGSNFFDDEIVGITGYEIKQKVLASGMSLAN